MNTPLRALLGLVLSSSLSFAAATVGAPAPDFTLVDTNGKSHRLADYAGKTVVIEWVNHGCPFVQKHYDSGNIPALQSAAAAEEVVWLSICSSAPGEQGHATPAEWSRLNTRKQCAAVAVLIDEDGRVGRLYDARTTPQMFIIEPKGTLVYAGGIDSIASANKDDIARAENYVAAALADLRADRPVATATSRPYGCSVKYAN